MSDLWSRLPVLPLKCVLEQLGLADALAATSVCRHWRHALLLYEGKRELLKLSASEPQRSEFLVRLFRRSARRLQLMLDCPPESCDDYLMQILPRFHDTALLHQVVFVGPAFSKLEESPTLLKIKRSTVENMLHSHRHTLQSIALVGCQFSTHGDDGNDEAEELNCQSEPLEEQPALFLSRATVKTMQFSSLHSLMLDYVTLEAELLESLCNLPQFSNLTLNLLNGKRKFEPLPWVVLEKKVSPLEVTVNIIGVPSCRFEEIMDNVLVDNLPLVAIRVMFCKVLHEPFILNILKFDKTLRLFHWVDCSAIGHCGTVVGVEPNQYDSTAVNPFILLCWRCGHLQDLVIHGYWLWQYDLLGMARLRHSSLQRLEASAAFHREHNDVFCKRDVVRPVVGLDRMPAVKNGYVQQMNQCLEFEWRPVRKLSAVHPALGPNSTEENRAEYALKYSLEQFGVT